MKMSHLIHNHNFPQVNKNVTADKLIFLFGGDAYLHVSCGILFCLKITKIPLKLFGVSIPNKRKNNK